MVGLAELLAINSCLFQDKNFAYQEKNGRGFLWEGGIERFFLQERRLFWHRKSGCSEQKATNLLQNAIPLHGTCWLSALWCGLRSKLTLVEELSAITNRRPSHQSVILTKFLSNAWNFYMGKITYESQKIQKRVEEPNTTSSLKRTSFDAIRPF